MEAEARGRESCFGRAQRLRRVRLRELSESWSVSTESAGEVEEVEEDAGSDTEWKLLPEILLEEVFSLLSTKGRHQASMVCHRWYECFYSPAVWETFVLLERTLTKRRFNLLKGYVRELCPRKTQVCLMRVGSLFKRIVVTPIPDFYNLYEFLRVLNAFLTFFEEFPMPMLHTFHFTFACEARGISGAIVYGTGGKILEELKSLLSNMRGLKHLTLNELLLDVGEVPGLLGSVARHCRDSLQSLELLNCTKVPYPLEDVTQFSFLSTLVISPQHLSEELVLLVAGMGVCHLHLVQDPYTCDAEDISHEAWKVVQEIAPHLRMTLEVRGRTKKALIVQRRAPVRRVIFASPYGLLQPPVALALAENYHKTLEVFAQLRLPRVHGSRSFHDRGDAALLGLVRQCSALHTLVVAERLSTATLLLLASEGRSLRRLTVRQNALIKKCDWPRAANWSDEFYQWLRRASKDYELTNKEVSKILGYPWRPLRDEEFIKRRLISSN